ncbi:MAG: hypothetical protein P8K78_07700, partial [Pirellulales bacterium]|nr:hypothetical protein [Pirellulales bacterium]
MGLPLVLLLFALIINAGFTGMWKLRLLGAAREVAWRSRDPRTSNLPNPDYQSSFWTQPTQTGETSLQVDISTGSPLDIPDLSSEAAVRANIGAIRVDTHLLDPKRGVLEGHSDIARKFPLLPNGLKAMRSHPKHYLTDDSFPFWNTQLSGNTERRTRVLYRQGNGVATTEFGDEWASYRSSASEIITNLSNDNLLPLGSFNVELGNGTTFSDNQYFDPEVHE